MGARRGVTGFVRVDDIGVDGVTIAAFADTPAAKTILIRACFLSWCRQCEKFEDMDTDLSWRCEEARMIFKPRHSQPCIASREDDVAPNILRPLTNHLQRFMDGGKRSSDVHKKFNMAASSDSVASSMSE